MAKGFTDWHRAYVLQGVDSEGNLVAVLLEEGGQLQVLLRGAFGDELRTVALDDDGNISAYVLDDEEQWGEILRVGNAELAARLGSPIAWDRRGQVQLLNDFRFGFGGYQTYGPGTGATIGLDPIYWQAGGHSVKLVGGSDGLYHDAGFTGHLGLPPSDTIGFAVRWSASPTPNYFGLVLRAYTGTYQYLAHIRYDFDNERLQYYNYLGSWVNLAVQKIYVQPYVFNSLKVVVNQSTNYFVRVLLNNTEYDLSAIQLFEAVSGITGMVSFAPEVNSHDGENDVAYIDYIAITTQE